MTGVDNFIQKRPVLTYYFLTFAISWGLFLLVGGRDLVAGADWDSNPRFVLAILAMLTGPAIAGLFLTWHLSGQVGLRELFARLARWRVSARWYAVALLTAPLLSAAVLLGLSLASPVFRPPIFTDEGKPVALLLAFGVGSTTLLEELGWTGFATPRLRSRHSVFVTGLIMGVPWAAWHLLQIIWVGGSTSEDVPLASYLPLYIFLSVASLTAYRILILWVYDRTESLFVATLMHASYAAFTLQIDVLLPKLAGSDLLIQWSIFSAALWVVVGVIVLVNRKQLLGRPPTSRPIARVEMGKARGSAMAS
jgi:membrane protease YdiL (CAAX protease family)